jgi:hypothetical protein
MIVLSTTPHPFAQSSCEQSPKDFAQHPANGIMPALSMRQCDVAGTHNVSSITLIATIAVRIRSDATAKLAGTSNYVTNHLYQVGLTVLSSFEITTTSRTIRRNTNDPS